MSPLTSAFATHVRTAKNNAARLQEAQAAERIARAKMQAAYARLLAMALLDPDLDGTIQAVRDAVAAWQLAADALAVLEALTSS